MANLKRVFIVFLVFQFACIPKTDEAPKGVPIKSKEVRPARAKIVALSQMPRPQIAKIDEKYVSNTNTCQTLRNPHEFHDATAFLRTNSACRTSAHLKTDVRFDLNNSKPKKNTESTRRLRVVLVW